MFYNRFFSSIDSLMPNRFSYNIENKIRFDCTKSTPTLLYSTNYDWMCTFALWTMRNMRKQLHNRFNMRSLALVEYFWTSWNSLHWKVFLCAFFSFPKTLVLVNFMRQQAKTCPNIKVVILKQQMISCKFDRKMKKNIGIGKCSWTTER